MVTAGGAGMIPRNIAIPVRAGSRRAFTLLEVVLALFLMIVILSGVYAFYATSLRARHEGGEATRDIALIRWILDRMADEIRHATDIVPGDGIGFSGTEDEITIIHTRMPELYAFKKFDSVRQELPPAQMDILRIHYQLLWDDEFEDEEGVPICHGLWRSEQKTFDPNPKFIMTESEEPGEDSFEEESEDQGEEGEQEQKEESKPIKPEGELLAPEIKYLKFEYFDGAEWLDRWQSSEDAAADTAGAALFGQGGYALPQAVKITIGRDRVSPEDEEFDLTELDEEEGFKDEEYHPDRFTVVVYLMQADQSLLSSRQYGLAEQLGRQEGVE